jgi:NTP pyrophosphatase (non-canonical NTP hydrolase)
MEEVGEVATAIQLKDQDNLKEELIHVASVCTRWLEAL